VGFVRLLALAHVRPLVFKIHPIKFEKNNQIFGDTEKNPWVNLPLKKTYIFPHLKMDSWKTFLWFSLLFFQVRFEHVRFNRAGLGRHHPFAPSRFPDFIIAP